MHGRFYLIVVLEIAQGEKKVFWFYEKSPLYQILDMKSLLLKDITKKKKNNPQS